MFEYNSPRWKCSTFLTGQILIEIPMVNPSRLVDALRDKKEDCDIAEDHEDPWHWWNKLRSTADFTEKLSVALELSADIPSKWEISRWLGISFEANANYSTYNWLDKSLNFCIKIRWASWLPHHSVTFVYSQPTKPSCSDESPPEFDIAVQRSTKQRGTTGKM